MPTARRYNVALESCPSVPAVRGLIGSKLCESDPSSNDVSLFAAPPEVRTAPRVTAVFPLRDGCTTSNNPMPNPKRIIPPQRARNAVFKYNHFHETRTKLRGK